MSYKYMLLDSRGAPVAQGVSEDGPEKKTFGSSGSPTGISSGCWGMIHQPGGNLGAVPGDGRADCPVPG